MLTSGGSPVLTSLTLMLKTLISEPRSLLTLTWYNPESLDVTLSNRKVPLLEYSSVPLFSFFRITADGGKLIVWQQTVTFCPSLTSVDGKMMTVVFLGGALTVMEVELRREPYWLEASHWYRPDSSRRVELMLRVTEEGESAWLLRS